MPNPVLENPFDITTLPQYTGDPSDPFGGAGGFDSSTGINWQGDGSYIFTGIDGNEYVVDPYRANNDPANVARWNQIFGDIPTQESPMGDMGIRSDMAQTIGKYTSPDDFFSALGPWIVLAPFAVYMGANAIFGVGGLIESATAAGMSAADTAGLAQMGADAGLSGEALQTFVSAGGMADLTPLAGLPGYPTGGVSNLGEGLGDLFSNAGGGGAGGLSEADIAGLTQMGQDAGLSGEALEAFVNAGGMADLSPLAGLPGAPDWLVQQTFPPDITTPGNTIDPTELPPGTIDPTQFPPDITTPGNTIDPTELPVGTIDPTQFPPDITTPGNTIDPTELTDGSRGHLPPEIDPTQFPPDITTPGNTIDPTELPLGTQLPAPVQFGPTIPGPGIGGSQPPIVPGVPGGGVPGGIPGGGTSGGGGGVPGWLQNLFPGISGGDIVGLITGILGSNATNQGYQDLANSQAQSYADAQQAYYDSVNRQTTGYQDAVNAYNSRTSQIQNAYDTGQIKYDEMVDLLAGAWNEQMGQYGSNVEAQQQAYQDSLARYDEMVGLQGGAYEGQLSRYDTNYDNQLEAYQNSLDRFDRTLGLQSEGFEGQMDRYDTNVANQQNAYQDALGLYGQQNEQQMAAYGDRKAQYDAERERLTGLGAPYRGRLESLYADPSAFLNSAEVQVPVQQASDIMARSLSMGGNPTGSGNALQQLQNYSANQLFGKLGEEKTRLGTLGGLTGAAYQSPDATTGPTALQSFPGLATPGSMPGLPGYSSNAPNLASPGGMPSIPGGPQMPGLTTPGGMPGIPNQPQTPQLANPGSFPTMPNPPAYPQRDYTGATNAIAASGQPYNMIGSFINRLFNPQTGTVAGTGELDIAQNKTSPIAGGTLASLANKYGGNMQYIGQPPDTVAKPPVQIGAPTGVQSSQLPYGIQPGSFEEQNWRRYGIMPS